MKRISRLFTFFACLFFKGAALACPFCSENLAKNTDGFSGGLTIGIVITIFFMLGIMGSVVGFIAYLMIKEGKKSEKRHELAQASSAVLPSSK